MRLIHLIVALSIAYCAFGLEHYDMPTDYELSSEHCLTRKIKCRYSAMPSYDGTCNNLKNPTQGATDTVLTRLLPPEYDDLKDKPKSKGVFRALPSTRSIANVLKDSKKSTSNGVSFLHVLYGQFLAHDIVFTPKITKENGSELDCDCYKPEEDCYNIRIPIDDIQRKEANRKCMPFSRSKAAVGFNGCKFPHREQLSELSSIIDASFVYGKSDEEARELRDATSSSGELKTAKNPVAGPHQNLPNQDQLKHEKISETIHCPIKVHTPKDIPCFVSGDVRANENPGILSLHTIMVRYHNYIAKNLKYINPTWTSDDIFNVARKIVIAVYQSITFREYLPPLLGPLWMKRFNLNLVDGNGYWYGYDSRYNAAISNEFATAAFRYGHSQVSDIFRRPDSFLRRDRAPDVNLTGSFFTNDAHLDKDGGGSGAILRGLMVSNAQRTDTNLVDSLRNQLFTEFEEKFGGDLFAINMQRGRDHGLPSYNKYKELCGLPRAKTFHDLKEMPIEIRHRIRQAYDSVDDIDLYAGGLAETPVEGGQVGPTFACILAYGFRSLRTGDRYWHESHNSPSAFTRKQLASIRKTTFASILCQVGEDMKVVVKSPLLMENGKPGKVVSCASIPGIDLYPWQEQHHLQDEKSEKEDFQWTAWFVTKYTDETKLDPKQAALQILYERPDEACKRRLGYETRTVPYSSHIQIRFACPIGTIRHNDFPFQLSQFTYLSSWVNATYSKSGHYMSLGISELKCKKIIAIQAMSNKTFAGETGDVFEKFGIETGFLCRDEHQLNGKCHTYQVRALCYGKRVEEEQTSTLTSTTTSPLSNTSRPVPSQPSPRKVLEFPPLYPDPVKPSKQRQYPPIAPASSEFYPDPSKSSELHLYPPKSSESPILYPETKPPAHSNPTKTPETIMLYPEATKPPEHHYPKPFATSKFRIASKRAKSYCEVHGVCCTPPGENYVNQSPSFPVLKYAKNLCKTYSICCQPIRGIFYGA